MPHGKAAGPILRALHPHGDVVGRHYFVTVCVGLLILAASVWSIVLLARDFCRRRTRARSLLAIELPPGSRLSDTEKVTEDIVKLLRDAAGGHHRLRRWRAGSARLDGGPQGVDHHQLHAEVQAFDHPEGHRARHRRKLDDIPDIHHWFVDENGLRAISLVVVGSDSMTVANVASELASQMRRTT